MMIPVTDDSTTSVAARQQTLKVALILFAVFCAVCLAIRFAPETAISSIVAALIFVALIAATTGYLASRSAAEKRTRPLDDSYSVIDRRADDEAA